MSKSQVSRQLGSSLQHQQHASAAGNVGQHDAYQHKPAFGTGMGFGPAASPPPSHSMNLQVKQEPVVEDDTWLIDNANYGTPNAADECAAYPTSPMVRWACPPMSGGMTHEAQHPRANSTLGCEDPSTPLPQMLTTATSNGPQCVPPSGKPQQPSSTLTFNPWGPGLALNAYPELPPLATQTNWSNHNFALPDLSPTFHLSAAAGSQPPSLFSAGFKPLSGQHIKTDSAGYQDNEAGLTPGGMAWHPHSNPYYLPRSMSGAEAPSPRPALGGPYSPRVGYPTCDVGSPGAACGHMSLPGNPLLNTTLPLDLNSLNTPRVFSSSVLSNMMGGIASFGSSNLATNPALLDHSTMDASLSRSSILSAGPRVGALSAPVHAPPPDAQLQPRWEYCCPQSHLNHVLAGLPQAATAGQQFTGFASLASNVPHQPEGEGAADEHELDGYVGRKLSRTSSRSTQQQHPVDRSGAPAESEPSRSSGKGLKRPRRARGASRVASRVDDSDEDYVVASEDAAGDSSALESSDSDLSDNRTRASRNRGRGRGRAAPRAASKGQGKPASGNKDTGKTGRGSRKRRADDVAEDGAGEAEGAGEAGHDVATDQKLSSKPQSRSSKYRGVTRHRRSGRWEAHIWIKEINRQVYLGGYEQEEHAAEAYDVAALKTKGTGVATNFPLTRYSDLLDCMGTISLEELIMAVRRQSQGFSRGSSSYRGVTAHPSGRWESRIGVPGSKHVYLGLFEQERDAACAYDQALVRLRGTTAATNFALSDYRKELAEFHQAQQAVLLRDKRMEDVMAGGTEFEKWVKLGSSAFPFMAAAMGQDYDAEEEQEQEEQEGGDAAGAGVGAAAGSASKPKANVAEPGSGSPTIKAGQLLALVQSADGAASEPVRKDGGALPAVQPAQAGGALMRTKSAVQAALAVAAALASGMQQNAASLSRTKSLRATSPLCGSPTKTASKNKAGK